MGRTTLPKNLKEHLNMMFFNSLDKACSTTSGGEEDFS